MSMRGQSSGDFKETSGRVHLFHPGTRNSVGALAADAFTQSNPVVYTSGSVKSTTLTGISKLGVLGGSVAFTRPSGNNLIGGPVVNAGPAFIAGIRPLGIFLNDALGNAFENTPGVASGRGPYMCGTATIGVTIYETFILQATGPGNAGDALVYAPGDLLYASANGLLTKNFDDSYEALQNGATAATIMGIVKASPDANTPMLVLDLRV
jgi:hypothetical protein